MSEEHSIEDHAISLILMKSVAIMAGCSYNKARAAYRRYCQSGNPLISVSGSQIADPKEVARIAEEIGIKLDIGRHRINRQIRERAVAAAAVAEKRAQEMELSIQNHPWKRGDQGRSIASQPGGRQQATLTCRCGNSHDIGFRQLAGSDQMDRKFTQAGWQLDPPRCPLCQPKRNAPSMSATPSAAAIKSQAAMFRTLSDNFDADLGRYADGWSDQKIATDTGLSVQTIAAFRTEMFGPLKEPEEMQALSRDMDTFDGMLIEAAATMETLRSEHTALKTRFAEVRKRFAS